MAGYITFSPSVATAVSALSSFPPKRPPPREIPKRGSPTPREKEVAETDDTEAKTDRARRKIVKKAIMVVRCQMKILRNLARLWQSVIDT
jgi:hypothetical protein